MAEQRVSISDLKAHLSAYLNAVRDRGDELVVCDRHRPIARVVPIAKGDGPEHLAGLLAHRPESRPAVGHVRGPALLKDVDVLAILEDLRGER
jgi:prevent-host-death family protein